MIVHILLFVLGCLVSSKDECNAETPCPFGEECIEGQCVAQTCATSSQCAIEQFCGDDNLCAAGCKEHTDCRFGDLCDEATATCVQAECTDSKLDCGFGEFCSMTGDCYDAGGYFCQDCEDDPDCGGNGNRCLWGYCGVQCDSDRDCPGGYDCLALSDGTGNIIDHQCYATCYLMEGRE